MNCSPFDIKDYFLKELPDASRRPVEDHLRTCAACREELDRLRLTEAALFALRDEEIPQRIGFVSDEVFEPAPWRRWWGALWGSAARLGFASAAMLTVAILVHAFVHPAPVIRLAASPAVTIASISPAEVQNMIQAAQARSERESDARHAEQTQKLVADSLRAKEQDRKMLAQAEELKRYFERTDGARKVNEYYRTAAETRLLP